MVLKKMNKIFVFALICISILSVSVPGFAAKSDVTEYVTCTECKGTAVMTTCFSEEDVNYDERDYFDGPQGLAHYIRFYMRVPTVIECDSCGYYRSFNTYYWTGWQFMGY